MQSNNYVVIQGWMCNELQLKGNELLIFALIHGFSQDNISKFRGGRKYIADTFNISLPTVDKALQGLVNKNYLCKEGLDDFVNPNIYWVNFEVVKKLYEGSKETLHGGSKETLLNNTSKQTTSKKEKVVSKDTTTKSDFTFGKTKPKKENLYTKCVTLIDSYDFSNWGNIRKLLIEYLQFRISVKEKPLYTNMWKGMLNKLVEMCDNDIYMYESIIKQSIERGYLSFYPISSGSKNDLQSKPWEKGVRCDTYTEEELEELRRIDAEREAQGLQTRF